jgi:uncharacterized RDD family membrane protein YckC
MLGRGASGNLDVLVVQSQSLLSGQTRQSIWWMNGEPINTKGHLLGTWWNGSELTLLYPKTAYFSRPEQTLQLALKAPRKQQFVALGERLGDRAWHVLSRDPQTGAFFRQASVEASSSQQVSVQQASQQVTAQQALGGESSNVAVLAPYEKKTFYPWSSPRFPAIWFPQQEGLQANILCVFSPDFSQCKFLPLQLEDDHAVIAFSEDPDGLWLLPEGGTMGWKWDGETLKPAEMPTPAKGQHWLSIAPHPQDWAGVQDGPEGLQLWKNNQQLELPLLAVAPVPKRSDRPIWLQWILFGVMVTSLIAILNWRREGRLHNNKPVKMEDAQPATVTSRVLAFLIDIFILNTPLTLLSSALNLPEIPAEQLEALASGDLSVQVEFLTAISTVLINNVILLVGLSFVYHVIMEKTMGASLGKLFLHLQVVNLEGTSPKLMALIIRSLIRSLDLILPIPPSLLFAIFSSKNLSLADRGSSTRVIKLS